MLSSKRVISHFYLSNAEQTHFKKSSRTTVFSDRLDLFHLYNGMHFYKGLFQKNQFIESTDHFAIKLA